MFFHIFKYSLKSLLRQKEGIFWTLFFPVILSTLFHFAFSNINSDEKIVKTDIALISSQISDVNLENKMNDSNMFNITKLSEDEAKEKLKDGKITGYVYENNGLKMVVKKTGLQESILKTFLDGYAQMNNTNTTIAKINSQGNIQELKGSASKQTEFISQAPINKSNNVTVVYYYALLAMTCLMSATYGVYCVMNIQANQSSLAARKCIAPTHKLKVFFATISATVITQMAGILIVLFYLRNILKVDFGNSFGYVILFSFVSILTGITMGTAVSAVLKISENAKIGIIISFTMICSFLAGLMSTDIKYIVQSKFPPISYINPANLITDGFLSLYFYNSLSKYYLNLGILAGLAVAFSAITYLVLRRQKYASI